jgi:hypothetical protein
MQAKGLSRQTLRRKQLELCEYNWTSIPLWLAACRLERAVAVGLTEDTRPHSSRHMNVTMAVCGQEVELSALIANQ